jgi:hypothetical protein
MIFAFSSRTLFLFHNKKKSKKKFKSIQSQYRLAIQILFLEKKLRYKSNKEDKKIYLEWPNSRKIL